MRRALALALLAACATQPTGTISIDLGLEADALTRAPAVTTLVAEAVFADGRVVELGRGALPLDRLDLGDVGVDEVGVVRARGEDATGKAVVGGASLPVRFGALETSRLLLFLQRNGQLSRMASPFAAAPPHDLVTLVADRYLLAVEVGQAAAEPRAELYDLANLAPVTPRPALPITPSSMIAFGTRVLLISEAGKATVYDLSTRSTTDLAAPAGGTFADVAGGSAIQGADGVAYVVGGTRRRLAETAKVLRIAKDGALSFVSLSSPRRGAAATWVDGRGLVVVGGSAAAAGVEVLGPTAEQGAPLPFAPLAAEGLAATSLDGARLLVAGGGGPIRGLDLACAAACAPAAAPGPTLEGATARVAKIPASAGAPAYAVWVVEGGDRARVATQDGTSLRELPGVARAAGAPVALPSGNVAIVGGAREIESYRP